MYRRTGGRETWDRLSNWDRGQADSERLAFQILKADGYNDLDPSHPLGGKDGGKDIICKKDGMLIIGAVYFPRGKKSFNEIKRKFLSDLNGVYNNKADGIAFITNQELNLNERKKLSDLNRDIIIEIYHLERITNILNNPVNYGVRYEFLDIEFTKEEMLSYHKVRDSEYYEKFDSIYKKIDLALTKLDETIESIKGYATGGDSFCFIVPSNNEKQSVLMTKGKYPIYNVNIQIVDPDISCFEIEFEHKVNEQQPNTFLYLNYKLTLKGLTKKKYIIYYRTKNRSFHQILYLFKINDKVLCANRVIDNKNNIIFENIAEGIVLENIQW